ncbi:MAG: hypothetical protein J7K30_11685 [Deltaproteobacteria bacterium]|nr:hypothetical protein [Deltaproteobacteria bacterium]
MKYVFFLMIAGFIATGFLCIEPAMAEWSDHYSRKSSAKNSASTTLKYGGTYGQAGQNYINNRDNWKVPKKTGQGDQKSQMTPKEKAKYNRIIQKTNRLLNDIYNKPHQFGPHQKQMSSDQKAEYNRVMQQSADLIKRIESDPMLK